MTLQEANEKIEEVANYYQIETVQYNDLDFRKGRENVPVTFRCIPKFSFETKTVKPIFSCWLREMKEYTVEEMYDLSVKCKNVAMCVADLEEFFAHEKITFEV